MRGGSDDRGEEEGGGGGGRGRIRKWVDEVKSGVRQGENQMKGAIHIS